MAFHASISEALFAGVTEGPKIVLIAGRTPDNPGFFKQALACGATHILLEKPGAPTVALLEEMAALAKAKGVPVFMGFIKNIATYVEEALAAAEKTTGKTQVKLVSRNDYKSDEASLGECFSRNSEGMLKNMAIHELALAAQFFGMRADNIVDVSLDAAGSECLTLGDFTDFSRIDFTLTNDKGAQVRISSDRCSGSGCCSVVTDADGAVVYEKEMVEGERATQVAARMAAHPDWFSYLITQEFEYAKLKQMCSEHATAGTLPPGVSTIEIAIEALKLAEYLTPLIKAKLSA